MNFLGSHLGLTSGSLNPTRWSFNLPKKGLDAEDCQRFGGVPDRHGSVISSEKKIEDEKAGIQDNPNRIPGADGGTAPAKAGAAGNEKPKGE